MGRQALYRKYRSRTLGEVVGQDHVTSVLGAAIKGGNFSHAYLLTGPRGIGKTSVARIIAHLVNDLPYDATDHIDIVEIDAASNTGVDNIRDLRDKANIAPTSAKYKVYIIDEVHMLSGGAFNALLKTLEEPPAHVIFILATTEVQKLPATILSRTQRFHFRPVEESKVSAHLRSIADAEKIDIDDEALNLIARRGGGSFRDSISLLDQLSGMGQKISINDVENILGLAPEEQIASLAEAVIGRKSKTIIEILKSFREQGVATSIIVEQLITKLAELADGRAKVYEIIEKLIDVPKSANPEIKLLAILAAASAGNDSVATHATPSSTIVVEEKPAKAYAVSKPVKSQNAFPNALVPSKRSEPGDIPIPDKSGGDPVTRSAPLADKSNKRPEKHSGDFTVPNSDHPEDETDFSVSANKSDWILGQAQDDGAEDLSASEPVHLSEIDWDKVVAEAKDANGPCGSLIGGASIDFEDGVLTLYYNHKIHRTKMADNKYRKVLGDALMKIYDTVPKIVIADGPKPKSEVAAKVADIMGI
ncbi:hypothetical protein FACS189431_0800 [Alphaproteobacteria bacterium]|nr:hypothetical protein FACS189431_0800 [Alphaproteobacteria bacterium]